MDSALDKLYKQITGPEQDRYLQDIQKHLPTLTDYAGEVHSAMEFGCRSGNSTTAILRGLPVNGTLFSVDINLCPREEAILQACKEDSKKWFFMHMRSVLATHIDVELLFIDALHTYEDVRNELQVASTYAKSLRYIIFHDTELFGWFGQTTRGKPGSGILPAILSFMYNTPHRWYVDYYTRECCGLLVLKRA